MKNAVVCVDCGGRGADGEPFSAENCAHLHVVPFDSLSKREREAYESLSRAMTRGYEQVRSAKDALRTRARAAGVIVTRALPSKVTLLHAV